MVDGRDLAPVLGGEIERWPEPRPLIFHYPHQWTGKPVVGYQPHSSIRLGDWKAIYFYQPQRWELYNLREDLGETSDLAASREALGRVLSLPASVVPAAAAEVAA